jgi:hypothetical protein
MPSVATDMHARPPQGLKRMYNDSQPAPVPAALF